MRYALPPILAAVFAAGCMGDVLGDDDAAPVDAGGGDGGGAGLPEGGPGVDAGSDGGLAGDPDGGIDPTDVCAAWNAGTSDVAEGTWSGNASALVCDAGDMDAAWRARALAVTNAYRALADLPPITTSAERNRKAQDCALIQHARDGLSHFPEPDWDCFTVDGDEAAGSSNIATTPAVAAVSLYMVDPGAGNASTLGHRRWILSNRIGPTGFGSTSDFSCMWTLGGRGDAGATWTAFPPPGAFPIQAAGLVGLPPFAHLDDTGWSIQSDDVDLDDAEVTVTEDGAPFPVTVSRLLPNYGSRFAIKLTTARPLAVGSTYRVTVTNVSPPGGGDAFDYAFTVVDCAE